MGDDAARAPAAAAPPPPPAPFRVEAVVEPTELRVTLECVTELRARFAIADAAPDCCIGVTPQRHGLARCPGDLGAR